MYTHTLKKLKIYIINKKSLKNKINVVEIKRKVESFATLFSKAS